MTNKKTQETSVIYKKVLTCAVAVCAGAGTIVACGGDSDALPVGSGTIVQNATVVDTRDGSLQSGMNLVLADGQIKTITSQALTPTGNGVQVVDATGKYVVPGFLDMHTHAAGTLAASPNDFPVLLANGVTGVREAGGSPALIQAVRQQNAKVVAGTADAPEVLMMPSTIFAGQSPTDAGARQFVRDRLAEGADFIKIVGGAPAAFLAAIDEAKKQGSSAAGHLPVPVRATDASNAGYRSFEHLGSGIGVLLDCAADEAAIRAGALATPVPPPVSVINPRIYDGNPYAPFYQRVIDTYDATKCATLAKTFVQNDSWQTVTLIRLRTSDFGADPIYTNDANLKYVDKARVASWRTVANQFATTVSASSQATLQAYYALQLKAVKLMKDNGVKILAGSDLGGGWVIPGFGLHQEFRELAAAGLTPLEVLQATTLSGARFVGREATMGTVEQGKNADLVLLDANPIADVANLDRVNGVFLRGRYYSRAALDKLLSDVAAGYAAQPEATAQSVTADPTHPPHY
ncbi:amidohydrolase family protein [soil metagenome]